MKVKIAYTVDLDNVPVEAAKMLEKFSPNIDKLTNALDDCKKQVILEDITNSIKSLEEMNAAIYECSLIVGDCYSILKDYLSTKFPTAEVSEDATEEG